MTSIRGFIVLFAFALFLGRSAAEEFAGTLQKIEDGKITFSRLIAKKKVEATLPADEKCRVFAAKYNKKTKTIDAADEFAGGLMSPIFKQLEKGTIDAWIRTNADNDRIVELRLYQSIKKKKS